MVFARGGDNALYANRQVDAEFTGWQGLGGYLTSDPAAIGLGRGEGAQVFARNGGGGVDTIRWTGSSWTGWQDLGGSIQGNPTAETTPTYNPDTRRFTFVLARGTDDSLVVNRFDGFWSGWQSLGGVLRSDRVAPSPELTSHAVYVAVRGTDDGVHVNRWTRHEGWRGWSGLGGATVRAPGMAAQYAVPAQVFGVGLSNNAGYHREVY